MNLSTLGLFFATIFCYTLTFVVSASRETRNSEWKEWLEIFSAITTVYLFGTISQQVFGYNFIFGWAVALLTFTVGYNLQFRRN